MLPLAAADSDIIHHGVGGMTRDWRLVFVLVVVRASSMLGRMARIQRWLDWREGGRLQEGNHGGRSWG